MTSYCFKVDKLIRDKIPQILRQKGLIVPERVMDKEEFLIRLKDKLMEEAGEVTKACYGEELVEELADLMEVIYALCQAYQQSFDEVERKRIEKKEKCGGFDRKIYNPSVEVQETNPLIEYYLARPDRYPVTEAD